MDIQYFMMKFWILAESRLREHALHGGYFRENKHDFRKGPTEANRPWSAFLQNVLFRGKANSELFRTFKKIRIGSISKKLQKIM